MALVTTYFDRIREAVSSPFLVINLMWGTKSIGIYEANSALLACWVQAEHICKNREL